MMKKGVIIFMVLLLANLAYALDSVPPKIDKLEILQAQENVVEITWWVSDDQELGQLEIYKNGNMIKQSVLGGTKQSSKYRDLLAIDVNDVYTLRVLDAAGNEAEKNVSLKQDMDKTQAEIEKNQPADQVVVEAPAPAVAEAEPAAQPPAETPPLQESPASSSDLGYIVLLALFIGIILMIWIQRPSKKVEDSLGLDEYLEKRRR